MLKSIRQSNIKTAVHYTQKNVATERFLLSDYLQQHNPDTPDALQQFQQQTGLANLYWQATYYQWPGFDGGLPELVTRADGYVFFMHGWTGSHRIWENLPVQLAGKHKNIICFNLDVNGFGQSPFISQTPTPQQCSPASLMNAVETWLQLVGLRPAPPNRKRKPFYLFVGHSMSGAALFFKDAAGWAEETCGSVALAPALFYNDAQRKTFFKTMGISIGLPSFNAVKDRLAPRIIDLLGPGASVQVKNEHLRIYNQTPFGTLAQTLYVLGTPSTFPQGTDLQNFKIFLGHKDRIVGLDNMLNLLETLNFNPAQLRVMLGDHYFFSYGKGSPESHNQNRKLFFAELLDFCYQLTGNVRQE
ncbi:MAG: alpha/beta hydrolase [Chloroflexi bacterium]|nr:MAG: alpha/beta hydrolase [Chloroflexota bacterium]